MSSPVFSKHCPVRTRSLCLAASVIIKRTWNEEKHINNGSTNAFQYKVISPNLKPVSGTGLPRHYETTVLFAKDNEKGENMKKKEGEGAIRKKI